MRTFCQGRGGADAVDLRQFFPQNKVYYDHNTIRMNFYAILTVLRPYCTYGMAADSRIGGVAAIHSVSGMHNVFYCC
jgi:hypothetical protein